MVILPREWCECCLAGPPIGASVIRNTFMVPLEATAPGSLINWLLPEPDSPRCNSLTRPDVKAHTLTPNDAINRSEVHFDFLSGGCCRPSQRSFGSGVTQAIADKIQCEERACEDDGRTEAVGARLLLAPWDLRTPQLELGPVRRGLERRKLSRISLADQQHCL